MIFSRIILLCLLFPFYGTIHALAQSTAINGLKYVLYSNFAELMELENSEIKELVIPDTVEYNGKKYPVTRINYNSLKSSDLEKIVIPKTVQEIFHPALQPYHNPQIDCPSLHTIEVDEENEWLSAADGVLYNKDRTKLFAVAGGKSGVFTIPESVEEIGGYSMQNCRKLTEVIIPESVTRIDDGAFNNCRGLKRLIIPQSVTYIGTSAFSATASLESIELPRGLEEIGYGSFSSCGMTRFIIPDGVKDIEYEAFIHCESLESITIPNSVTSIGPLAFSRCKSLKHIVIPSSVTSIGEWAFSHCGIENLEIEKGIKVIGSACFQGCDQMASLVIPEGVTYLGSSSFQDCCSLHTVKFPETLEEIIGYTFRRCSSLKEIHIPASVKKLDKRAFDGCPLERVFIEQRDVDIYKDFLGALDKSVILYVHKGVLNKTQKLYSGTILSIEDYETGISHVPTTGSNNEERLYDLQGRRLKAAPQRGMYIRNGRKYVVK